MTSNALKQAVEQEHQQRRNDVVLTLWEPQLNANILGRTQPYATTSCLTPSSSLPLRQGAKTLPQKGATKSKQPI